MRPFDQQLAKAVVGVAGLGGLGSTVVLALARAGVGAIVIADHDIVEADNLDRQHYFLDQVGMPKVQAIAQTIQRVDPAVRIDAFQVRLDRSNIPQIFARSDVIVECLDQADQKQMLVETVLVHMSQPVVAASGLAGCGRSNEIRTRQVSKRLYLVGDGQTDVYAGIPVSAGRVWIAAAHQANTVLAILLGQEP